MLVLALVTSVGTDPEPSVQAILDGLDKVLADLVRGGLLVALLGQHNRPQLLLVPVRRRFSPFLLLLFRPGVCVQALLVRLSVQFQVVGELALLALFAVALLVEDTQDCLGVDAEGHLLDLGGLVHQSLRLALCGLGSQLLLLALGFLGGLLFLLGGAATLCLGLHLLDGPLGGTALLVLHAEGLVLDGLLGVHLLGGALVGLFGRHLCEFGVGNAGKAKRRETNTLLPLCRLF